MDEYLAYALSLRKSAAEARRVGEELSAFANMQRLLTHAQNLDAQAVALEKLAEASGPAQPAAK